MSDIRDFNYRAKKGFQWTYLLNIAFTFSNSKTWCLKHTLYMRLDFIHDIIWFIRSTKNSIAMVILVFLMLISVRNA